MKKRYSTLQIKTDVKEKLDAFCDANGYKLSGFVEKLIENAIGFAPQAVASVNYVGIDANYMTFGPSGSGSIISDYSQSYYY